MFFTDDNVLFRASTKASTALGSNGPTTRSRLPEAKIDEMAQLEVKSDAAQNFSQVDTQGRVTEILSSDVEGIH